MQYAASGEFFSFISQAVRLLPAGSLLQKRRHTFESMHSSDDPAASPVKCTPCQGQIKKKGFMFSNL